MVVPVYTPLIRFAPLQGCKSGVRRVELSPFLMVFELFLVSS